MVTPKAPKIKTSILHKSMLQSPESSQQFLTLEESNAVDAALLASHEKFLTRLTISSLKVLKQIAKDAGVPMDDLNAPQIIAWFENDGKIRREQGSDAAFLKW